MPPANQTILLVDDNPAFLQNLVLRMEMAGYRVLTAQDGMAARAPCATPASPGNVAGTSRRRRYNPARDGEPSAMIPTAT